MTTTSNPSENPLCYLPALIDLIRERSLRTDQAPYTLSSGQTSDYYLDLREVTLSSEGLALIGPAIIDTLIAHFPHCQAIGGPSLGADPIIGAALHSASQYIDTPPEWADLSLLRGFLVRPNPKTHGAPRLTPREPA